MSTITTQAPATSAYVYAADTAVDAYKAGAVRLDVVRRAAHTAMADAIADGDLATAQLHVATVTALDAVAKSATSTARVITATDYAKATVTRASAMYQAGYGLVSGNVIPTDVPQAMHADYRAALTEITGDLSIMGSWSAFASSHVVADSDTDSATAYATRRVIGNASVDAHYKAIAEGRAYDRHGAAFVPVQGTAYPFSVIAGLRSEAYPDGTLSNGAAAAAFTRRDENKRPARFSYVTVGNGQTIPGSRATNGVRFDG